MTRSEFLLALDVAAIDGASLYVVVDHAGAPGLASQLRRHRSVAAINLFEGSKEQGAIDVAPFLLYFARDGTDPVEAMLLDWLRVACATSTSLLALRSTLPHEALAHALRRRLDVFLPDRMAVMLRYFDTRVFESLMQALTPAQCAQFLSVASRWQWLDRAGNLQSRDAEELPHDVWPSGFELDVRQQTALIENGEADALASLMRSQAPDLCEGASGADLHSLANRCLPKMRKLAIEDTPSQALYCLAALQFGVDFDSQPEWGQIVERVAKRQLKFDVAAKEFGA